MYKKGQAALEFMSTYGLAFMIMLIVLGTISYMGIFNLSGLRNDECLFPSGMDCLDFTLQESATPNAHANWAGAFNMMSTGGQPGTYYQFILANTYGVNITLTDIQATVRGSSQPQGCALLREGLTDSIWPRGTNATVFCPFPSDVPYRTAERYDVAVNVKFRQHPAGVYEYNITGTISAAGN